MLIRSVALDFSEFLWISPSVGIPPNAILFFCKNPVDVVFFPVLASREKGLEILLDCLRWIFVQWMYPVDLPNGPLLKGKKKVWVLCVVCLCVSQFSESIVGFTVI